MKMIKGYASELSIIGTNGDSISYWSQHTYSDKKDINYMTHYKKFYKWYMCRLDSPSYLFESEDTSRVFHRKDIGNICFNKKPIYEDDPINEKKWYQFWK